MEIFIDLRTLAEMLGMKYQTVRRFRYPEGEGPRWREPTGFPKPWGTILEPGKSGGRAPVYAFSEVMDWMAEHRPYDLRIALELGNIGRDLAKLAERDRSQSFGSSSASSASN